MCCRCSIRHVVSTNSLDSLFSHTALTDLLPHPFLPHPFPHHPCSRHAEIYWEAAEKSFFIRNISTDWYNPSSAVGETGHTGGVDGDEKGATGGQHPDKSRATGPRGGSLYVRGEEVLPGDRGVPLKSQTVVQVGSVIFTFVLPSSKAAAHKQDIDVSTLPWATRTRSCTFLHSFLASL